MASAKARIILFTGSRNWNDRAAVTEAVRQFKPTIGTHGDCKGLDWIVDAVLQTEGIQRVKFPANWGGDGKKAGPLRNRLMYDLIIPHLVLAFPLPQSVGTWDMVNYAREQGCDVLVRGEDF